MNFSHWVKYNYAGRRGNFLLPTMNSKWPPLVFLWRPKQECQSFKDRDGETQTIITTENKLWLCFALEYTLADGSKHYVRWKRVPKER